MTRSVRPDAACAATLAARAERAGELGTMVQPDDGVHDDGVRSAQERQQRSFNEAQQQTQQEQQQLQPQERERTQNAPTGGGPQPAAPPAPAPSDPELR